MSDNAVLDGWLELKTLVESLDLDMHKNAVGNVTAGARVRKGLRLLKSKTAGLVKMTIEADKALRATRKSKPKE